MHLQPYLDRIGYTGNPAATLGTLSALLRHHALAVPFENLDVHLGLRRLEDGYWQFHEDAGDREFGFDFEPVAGDEEALARRCDYLRSGTRSSCDSRPPVTSGRTTKASAAAPPRR